MLRHFATCQMRPEIKDQGRDNVLLAQGYPTPQRAAMQRWWNRDKQGKTITTQRKKPASVPLYLPWISYEVTWD